MTKYTQLYRRSVRLQPRVVNSQDDRQRLFLHIAQSPNIEDQNPLCGQSLRDTENTLGDLYNLAAGSAP